MSRRTATRRGFTLVEVMVMVALSSVLVVMGVMLFSALIKAQRQFSLRERQRREFSRIDALLRTDAHAATRAAVEQPESCELQDEAASAWTYRLADDTLTRVRTRQGEVVQRESFQVPPGSKVEFKLAAAGKRTLLQLRLEPPTARDTYQGQFLIGGLSPAQKEEQP